MHTLWRLFLLLLILLFGLAVFINILVLGSPIEPVKAYGVTFSKHYAKMFQGVDWKTQYLAILHELGVKHLRFGAYWTDIEPKKGDWHFEDLDWQLAEAKNSGADVIVLDIANSQSIVALNAVKNFRIKFPDMELVVGNIVLPKAVSVFRDCGVNGFKVGLGPGSACTTRKNTNIGIPQAQAIYDCALKSNVPICADGGIKRNGSIATALMLGAGSVMIGGMFSGTDEAPGQVFRDSRGNKVKSFRGMASREAMHEKLHAENYDNPYEISSRISPEGIEKKVDYRGSVVPIINEMMDNLASTISYIGAMSLQEAKEMFMEHPASYLIKLSESAKRESWDR